MAVAQKIICDVCETEKKQSNHWILYLRARGSTISFSPWSDELFRNEATGHLCGAGCASKLLSGDVERWQQEVTRA